MLRAANIVYAAGDGRNARPAVAPATIRSLMAYKWCNDIKRYLMVHGDLGAYTLQDRHTKLPLAPKFISLALLVIFCLSNVAPSGVPEVFASETVQ